MMTTRFAALCSLSLFSSILGCNNGGGATGGSKDTATNAPANNNPSPVQTTQVQQPQTPAHTAPGHSTPPTTAEWGGVGEVTVHNSSSLGCETKMVREWLRASCKTQTADNAVTGVQVIRPTGDHEYFVYQSKDLASIVMPVRDNTNAEVRFSWQKWGTRDLRVSWPHGAPSASMSFDRGADAGPTSTATPAQQLACKVPADCPKKHCCLNPVGGSSCAAATCDIGVVAEVCTGDADCAAFAGMKANHCKPSDVKGVRTCQQ